MKKWAWMTLVALTLSVGVAWAENKAGAKTETTCAPKESCCCCAKSCPK